MNLRYAIEGLRNIETFFSEPFATRALEAAAKAILPEPDEALVRAASRIELEFTPRPTPPIQRVVSIIQEEGRKFRVKQAEDNENAWRREKGEDAQGRVNGDPLKAAARRSKLANDAIQLIELILTGKMTAREKAEGAQHMALTYPGIGYEDLACAWRSGRELEDPV